MAGSKVDMLIKARDQASPALAKVDKQLAGLEMSAAGLMTALGGGYALARVADFTWEMGKLGAESLDTRSSFESMMRSVGQSSGLLDEMRQAAGGTVSDLKLMQNASFALAGTSGELATAMAEAQPKMLEIARAAYKMNPALGSVEQLYQALNTGVKRNTPLLIDNLGIVVKQAEAQQKYAKQLGKSVSELTTADQQLALLNATLEGGSTLIRQIGGDVSSAGDAFAELNAILANLKTQAAEVISPTVVKVAEQLILALGGITEENRSLANVTAQLTNAQKELNAAQEAGNLSAVAGWQRDINRLEKEQATLLRQAADAVDGYSAAWIRMVDTVRGADEAVRDFSWTPKEPSIWTQMVGQVGGAAETFAQLEEWQSQAEEIRLGYRADRIEAEKETAAEITRIWENAYRDQRSTLESIMQPSFSFDATGMLDALGQHVDTWDEQARRMADVANRGAESPWAKLLDIPEDVLAEGGDKLKGYAASWIRDFQLGLHAGEIDKEAVKDLYRKMLGGKGEREAMLTELQKELGGKVDMSLLRKAAGVQDPAAAMIADWAKSVGESESEISGVGASFASMFVKSILESGAVEGFIEALVAKMLEEISDWAEEE